MTDEQKRAELDKAIGEFRAMMACLESYTDVLHDAFTSVARDERLPREMREDVAEWTLKIHATQLAVLNVLRHETRKAA